MIKVNKFFPFLLLWCFLKEIGNMFPIFLAVVETLIPRKFGRTRKSFLVLPNFDKAQTSHWHVTDMPPTCYQHTTDTPLMHHWCILYAISLKSGQHAGRQSTDCQPTRGLTRWWDWILYLYPPFYNLIETQRTCFVFLNRQIPRVAGEIQCCDRDYSVAIQHYWAFWNKWVYWY